MQQSLLKNKEKTFLKQAGINQNNEFESKKISPTLIKNEEINNENNIQQISRGNMRRLKDTNKCERVQVGTKNNQSNNWTNKKQLFVQKIPYTALQQSQEHVNSKTIQNIEQQMPNKEEQQINEDLNAKSKQQSGQKIPNTALQQSQEHVNSKTIQNIEQQMPNKEEQQINEDLNAKSKQQSGQKIPITALQQGDVDSKTKQNIEQQMPNKEEQQINEDLNAKSKQQSGQKIPITALQQGDVDSKTKQNIEQQMPNKEEQQNYDDVKTENTSLNRTYDISTPNALCLKQQPIALFLGSPGVGKTFLMKKLFNQSGTINEFELNNLQIDDRLSYNFVDTQGFDFESDIDEREAQIKLYQQLFLQYQNLVRSIFLVVNFERTDLMKKKLLSVYKYFRKFQSIISIIVTEFQESEDKDFNEADLRAKFQHFKPCDLIFVERTISKTELINKLKQKSLNQIESGYTFDLSGTIFEQEDEEETKILINQIKQKVK
ncbi:unnamed protein product (macronuclear) [Paramecium tetraurelia]|uniref:P-loop containing nucleoside triphosphate hydrolase n=1 Tax=Paramecium tetraurelia TaxID=5888 RepID=A0DME4_PARTE|nr:uncharacterized protein GSPATT00018429001 [Paramecium tetraurelia]CAK84211.1 unnamed protein product [Paramecium tetraurelia]|eukprot:XP_001451608.1 hypothetical protein (macronuclear) [Paramecium tetraurelia strain d4-2]